MTIRLGVNIDHVATVRNARGENHPDPLKAAQLAIQAGADGITLHLREDRRHIHDQDVLLAREALKVPLNLEMAATEEMVSFAEKLMPHACCIVPERRKEITTEGGLDAVNMENDLQRFIPRLQKAGIRVSLFIAPDMKQIAMAARLGANVVELHTGAYAHKKAGEWEAIKNGAEYAHQLGLEVHAGHGLTYENVQPIAALPEIKELNIGHFLIGEALFSGLAESVAKMKMLMIQARQQA